MQTSGGFWSVLFSFWAALLFCIAYAAVGYFLLSARYDQGTASSTIQVFVYQYGGLVAGTACTALYLMSILVLRTVPDLIEQALPDEVSEQADYRFWKGRLLSGRLGLAQFGTYFVGGFGIYSLLEFPGEPIVHLFFAVFAALQYSCGGFIGRKLWCVGHLLRSIEHVDPKSDLLDTEAFPRLIYLVNIFTFLTLLMTVAHTYFHARMGYVLSSEFAVLLAPLIYLPLVLALPVIVLFNFYPRMVVNRLYLKSIRQRKQWLADQMAEADESEFAKHKHSIDYEKYLNEEFRYRQRVALSELPVALTITVALVVTIARVLAS